MLTKSQLKIERIPQKRATQESSRHFRTVKQQNSRDHKPKNGSRNMPQIINSPSQRKIHINPNHPHQTLQTDPPSLSNSNASRPRNSQSFLGVDRVVQLHQRLKNLHLFYKTRIEQQKSRTAQRNQVFIGIIEQMQRSHNDKLSQLNKLVEQSHNDKKDVGLVDQRMNEIKGSIDEILKQSNDLKEGNERLEREIEDKELLLKEKEEELTKLKEEVMESRNQLESFQRLNLRENKRNKEILGIIEKTETNFAKKTSH